MSTDDLILEIILGAIRPETVAFSYYADASTQSPYPETPPVIENQPLTDEVTLAVAKLEEEHR